MGKLSDLLTPLSEAFSDPEAKDLRRQAKDDIQSFLTASSHVAMDMIQRELGDADLDDRGREIMAKATKLRAWAIATNDSSLERAAVDCEHAIYMLVKASERLENNAQAERIKSILESAGKVALNLAVKAAPLIIARLK